MTAKVTVKGIDEVIRNLNAISKDLAQAIDKGILATAVDIQYDAVVSIDNVTRGYKRVPSADNPNVMHEVSAPGEAPNTDSGDLVESIDVSHLKGSFEAFVFSDLDYGMYLEKVLNRPWLVPAMEKNKGELMPNIFDQLQRIVSK